MKVIKFIVGLIVVSLVFACSADEKEHSGQKADPVQHAVSLNKPAQLPVFASIPPKEAREMLLKRENMMFIDVRSPAEIAEVAVEGAEPIPMSLILRGKVELPKDKPILLMCAVGMRSYGVGRFLEHQGHREVYNLSGGIVAWEREGLAVVKK